MDMIRTKIVFMCYGSRKWRAPLRARRTAQRAHDTLRSLPTATAAATT